MSRQDAPVSSWITYRLVCDGCGSVRHLEDHDDEGFIACLRKIAWTVNIVSMIPLCHKCQEATDASGH